MKNLVIYYSRLGQNYVNGSIRELDKGMRYYHRTDAQLDQFAAWRPQFERA